MGARASGKGTPAVERESVTQHDVGEDAIPRRQKAPATMKRNVATLMNIPISKLGSVKEATAVTAMMIAI